MDWNVVIVNEFWDKRLEDVLFSGESVNHFFPNQIDWLELLVRAGVFSSKTQARKAGHTNIIPEGFTDLFVGKKKTRFTIWVPVSC